MTRFASLRERVMRGWRSEDGTTTVEFVVLFPLLFSVFVLAVDAGIMQFRQVVLHRAMDMAIREVRLGRITESDTMSGLICARTAMLPNCLDRITVEMRPIDTASFTGLDTPLTCVDLEEELTPYVEFNPGSGGAAQELMLVRVCVVADPFVRLTRVLTGVPVNPEGNAVLHTRGIFVKEPG